MAAMAGQINSHNSRIAKAKLLGRLHIVDACGNKSELIVWEEKGDSPKQGKLYYLCSNHARMPQALSNVFDCALPDTCPTTKAGRALVLAMCVNRCKWGKRGIGKCTAVAS
jgi:hypothetical protein